MNRFIHCRAGQQKTGGRKSQKVTQGKFWTRVLFLKNKNILIEKLFITYKLLK